MMKATQKTILSASILLLVLVAASRQGFAQSSQQMSGSDLLIAKNRVMLLAFTDEEINIASTYAHAKATKIESPKSSSVALPKVTTTLKPVAMKSWDELSAGEKSAFNQQLGGSAVKWTVPETSQTADAGKAKPFVFVNRGPQQPQH
jgi:hypothetical protein